MQLSVDGTDIHIATGGQSFDVAKPVVLLLHGAGMDHSVWTLQARYLAHHGYSVLAPDLPGHGRSSGVALASIEAIASWGWRLLDALDVKQAMLAGHSMGALTALSMAAQQPQRARSVRLIAVAAEMPVHPDLLSAAREDLSKASALIAMWGFGPTGQMGGNDVPGLQIRLAGQRLLERSKPSVLAIDLAACAAYQNGISDAANVTAPTHLLLGAEDRMTPATKGRQLAAAMSSVDGGAQITVLPGCGHMIMAERPDAATDLLSQLSG